MEESSLRERRRRRSRRGGDGSGVHANESTFVGKKGSSTRGQSGQREGEGVIAERDAHGGECTKEVPL